jgi:DNA-binding transcriptional regulator YiaG
MQQTRAIQMEKEEFNNLLKKADLTKKEFAGIIDMRYTSVNNWGSSQKFPRWVKSWLENYIEAKKFDEIKNILKDKVFEVEGK